MSGNKISDFFTPSSSRSGKRLRANSSPELEQASLRRAKMESDAVVGNLTFGKLMNGIMEGLSGLLDTKLSSLATKEDFINLSGEVSKLSKENEVLRVEISNMKSKESAILAKLDDLESRSRRNNLIFKGLKWSGTHVDFRALVRKFCADFFGCDESRLWVNRAHTLGRDSGAVIAHFPDDTDVQHIMNNVKKLKGTGFVVHRDYTREVRHRRAMLTAVRGEVERVCGRQRIPLIFDALILNNHRFTWEDNRLMAGTTDGADKLRELLSRDFKTFLEGLARDGPGRRRSASRGHGEVDNSMLSGTLPRAESKSTAGVSRTTEMLPAV